MPKLRVIENPEPRMLGPYERAASKLRAKDIRIRYLPDWRPKQPEFPDLARERILRDIRHGDEALALHLLAHPLLLRRVLASVPDLKLVDGILFRTPIKKPIHPQLGEDPFRYWYPALVPQGKNGWKLVRRDAPHSDYFCVFA